MPKSLHEAHRRDKECAGAGRARNLRAGLSPRFREPVRWLPRRGCRWRYQTRRRNAKALAAVQHLGVRTMRGDVAEKLLQLFALGDQVRRIESRPGQQDRCFDVDDAGKCRPLLIFARVGAKIGLFRSTRLGAQPIKPRHQHHAGDAGTAQLEFRVGQVARDVRRAGGVADGDDLVAISPNRSMFSWIHAIAAATSLAPAGPGLAGASL